MDSLMASSGPKDGSTSPSATPLEKEPGGESTRVTRGQSPVRQPLCPPPGGTTSSRGSPCPQLPDTRAEDRQRGRPYSAKCYTEGNKKISYTEQNGEYLATYHCCAKGEQCGLMAALSSKRQMSFRDPRHGGKSHSHSSSKVSACCCVPFLGGIFFFFLENTTGRNLTACTGKQKWQKATCATEFFFYLSIKKKKKKEVLAGTPGLYHAPTGPGRLQSLVLVQGQDKD